MTGPPRFADLPGRPLGGLRGPWAGFERLRVLDFTKLLPGPYATQILADLGCRVTKIELPHFADEAREMPPKIDGVGSTFLMVNQGKEFLPLDFRKPEGLAAAHALAAEADILIEGFRPGLMDRCGLGPGELMKLNGRLIYCSLTGYPGDGPWRRKAGHDLNFLAVSGFLGLSGEPAVPPTQVADLTGSLAAVAAVLAALVERGVTGRGKRVSVSMAETAHSLLPVPLGEALAEGRDPEGPRWWNGSHPFYRLYAASDGRWLAVAALEKPFALSLLDALGLESLRGLADDPLAHASELTAVLARVLAGASAAEWEDRLKDKDVCVTAVLGLGEARAFMDRLREPVPDAAAKRRRAPQG
ncbi:MAG: CoA transferase [Elusimicrobia bacterium]|nr:CoA transferase [Elusimicrobiota bacterium]